MAASVDRPFAFLPMEKTIGELAGKGALKLEERM